MKKILLFCITCFLAAQLFSQRYYQFRFEDLPRSYIVYTPKNFDPSENLPLVINMHGFSTDAAFHMDYTQYNKTADTARCIVVYPNGWEKRWSTGTTFGINTGIDDVGFLSEMMDRLIVLYNINARKIYATGYSAGGFMSYKLGCDLTNRIAAIAPNAGNMTYDNYNSCVPARILPLIAANGTADGIVPLSGIPDNFPKLDTVIRFWQVWNGCGALPVADTLPNISNDGCRVVKLNFTNCTNGIITSFYRILNGGHTWPGADDAFVGLLGKTTQDISWNIYGWQFFKQQQIPAEVVCPAPANLTAGFITPDSVQLSWDAVDGVDTFKIAIIDSSNTVNFYKTTNTTIDVKLQAGNVYRWNAASVCTSGYHNWNSTRPVQEIISAVKNDASSSLLLFPNPVKDFLEIGAIARQNNTRLTITNSIGQNLSEQILPANNRINVSQLEPGIYYLSISTGNKKYGAAFVKL